MVNRLFKKLFIKAPKKVNRIITSCIEYFYYRFFYSNPAIKWDQGLNRYLVCNGEDFNKVRESYEKHFPNQKQEKIKQADLICDHMFDLLGSGLTKLSQDGEGYQPIDWHIDFKSGHRWNPKIFYPNIKYGNRLGVDVKVPWELSRSQHLILLGQAYQLTKNKKYVGEFENQILDWIDNNPIGFGVNWRCTMDVAIRAANWLVAKEFFQVKDLLSQEFWSKFYISIYEHGKFIRSHLENEGLKNNHYLSDLVGLFYIAIYCPLFEESQDWHEFALKELSKEIDHQVCEDGCNFEASTSYHRLALELFFYAEVLGERGGIKFPKHYKDKVRKMFDFSLYCIKPDGKIPQIGDNDNGRFFIFNERPIIEHSYLLSLATLYYQESSFKLRNFSFNEEAFWLFGEKGKDLYDKFSFRDEPLTSKEFPDAGWYIMRHNNDYCFITCGPNGQGGNGGHAHNDKLSFELMIDGQDIIGDPGAYVYTSYPEERNRFRSTGYHNTVKFNGYEQNEILEKHIFSLPDRTKIKNVILKESENEVKFEGEIQYLDFTHKRAIILNKNTHNWQIIDNIFCAKPTSVKLMFHLSSGVYCNETYIFSKKTNKKIASIEVGGYRLRESNYDYSPEYGVKMVSKCLVADLSANKIISTMNTYINKL